ncbi:hypothetical protein LTS15_006944 [Exophiala xenobiotica]|nr:hypothetical protein LTS15_006944 [Exophiala xenobiotica]
MANLQKKFYLSPTWDNPPGGFIALGNVIISPKDPVPPLLAAGPNEIPPDIVPHKKKHFIWNQAKARKAAFGVYAKPTQGALPATAGFDMDIGKDESWSYTFESMDTFEFQPSPDFIAKMMNHTRIGTYLKSRWFDKRVFIINGIKVARTSSASSSTNSGMALDVDASLDITAFTGVPVSAGFKMGPNFNSRNSQSWQGSDDFVFAFSVLEVSAKRPEGQSYTKGAMLANDGEAEEEKVEYEVKELQGAATDVEEGAGSTIVSAAADFGDD